MMLAHDIVGKKEDEDIERQYESLLILIKHTVENLDKWIQAL